jgi:hypothetical protein
MDTDEKETIVTDLTKLDAVTRLSRDLREAAKTLTETEARYLVDHYYAVQEYRKASANQVRAMAAEPHLVLAWFYEQAEVLENQIKGALHKWALESPVGKWSLSVHGIGPVISAGLLAHIDITKAPTAGQIWSFAGLNPGAKWEKGEKRPWNAGLKTLCWKIGESFVKVSGNPKALYGRLYLERKAFEQQRNDAGELKEQAKAKLENFKIAKTTEAYGHYSSGKLPPAHIHARAKRWAVKLFLSHWHAVAYRYKYDKDAPEPYVFAHLHHSDHIEIPNWPF